MHNNCRNRWKHRFSISGNQVATLSLCLKIGSLFCHFIYVLFFQLLCRHLLTFQNFCNNDDHAFFQSIITNFSTRRDIYIIRIICTKQFIMLMFSILAVFCQISVNAGPTLHQLTFFIVIQNKASSYNLACLT